MDDHELEQLRDDVDRLQRGHDFYGEEERDQLRHDLRELTVRMDDMQAHIAELEQKLDRNQRQTAKAAGVTVADFDNVGEDTRRLARLAEPLPGLRAGLLEDHARSGLLGSIAAAESWRDRYGMAMAAALRLSGELSTSPLTDTDHADLAAAFRREHASVRRLAQQREYILTDERNSRAKLQADDAQREELAPRIETARQAAHALRERLNATLATAVAEDHLLPKWLEDTLGMPPAVPDDWLGWATEILAYRITYRITDLLQPLGNKEDAARPARRGRWYEWLRNASRQRALFREADWL